MAKKSKKINFKSIAERTLITAGTGAVAHVVAEAIDLKNPEYVDYGLLGVGVILPELVKGESAKTAADALVAVGGYRLAQRNDLAGKLGFNTAVAGIDMPVIGANSGWFPDSNKNPYKSKNQKKNTVN